MSSTKSPSPPSPTMEEPSPPSLPAASSSREEKERTIPFLRQLTEMLQNNEELISFIPGQRHPTETIKGRIVVHDRNRVQSEVLPVYFNHASFASLRRQLSYFSFVRVGKSRQSGVTYTNDSVVFLADILKLKRRGVGQSGAASAVKQQPKRAKKVQQPPMPQLPPVNQEIQLAATPRDVASAVLSGTLHAAKTNHNLDNNGNVSGPSPPRTSPVCHAGSATQSSISQSPESSSYSDGSNNATGKKRTTSAPLATKKKYKRRKSVVKHQVRGKERRRLDRLLSMNNIVPFIHLPMAAKQDEINVNGKEVEMTTAQKENSRKGEGPSRERIDSHGAINVLLALGSDRQ